MAAFLQWIDALWLIPAVLLLRRDRRFWAVGFIGACMLMLRLQAELMENLGYPYGMLSFMKSHVFYRALVVYGLFTAVYLAAARFSPYAQGTVLMATSLAFLFAAFAATFLVMVL